MGRKKGKSKSRSQKPFIGDQIFAVLHGLSCCCSSTILGTVAVFFLWIAKSNWPSELKKFDKWMQTKGYVTQLPGVIFALIWLVVTAISIWYVVSIWKGRAWVFWFLLFTNTLGFGVATYQSLNQSTNSQLQIVSGGFSGIVLIIYCIMRLSGKAGPKPT